MSQHAATTRPPIVIRKLRTIDWWFLRCRSCANWYEGAPTQPLALEKGLCRRWHKHPYFQYVAALYTGVQAANALGTVAVPTATPTAFYDSVLWATR